MDPTSTSSSSTQWSSRRLAVTILSGIAGFRSHDLYGMRPVQQLPFARNPSRCQLFGQFQKIAQERTSLWRRRRSEDSSVGGRWNEWLREHPDEAARCPYHRYDLAGASREAFRLWNQFSLATWTQPAVLGSISEEVPVELQLGTRSLIFDPVIAAPDGSDVANGEHRICAARLGGLEELFSASR